MKIDQVFSTHGGKDMVLSKTPIWEEIERAFTNPKIKFQRGESHNMKLKVLNALNKLGWADSVKIEPTNMTINFIKRRVALCLQLGNVSRTYADLLKIQLLFERKMIDAGVIAVPLYAESKKLGNNHAQYERLKNEVKLFDRIINAPIVLIGLST